jgi:hypothetical protein
MTLRRESTREEAPSNQLLLHLRNEVSNSLELVNLSVFEVGREKILSRLLYVSWCAT